MTQKVPGVSVAEIGGTDSTLKEIRQLKTQITDAIARLRDIALEPVDIPYGVNACVSFEVRPKADDDRIIVFRDGWGGTTVNYTEEGVIVDVHNAAADEVSTLNAYKEDLEDQNSDLEGESPTKSVTCYIEAYACDEYGDGPVGAKLIVTQKVIGRLKMLLRKISPITHSEVSEEDYPDLWLPEGIDGELHLRDGCIRVGGSGSFWFEARPKHSTYTVETRLQSIEDLESQFNAAKDGDVLYLGEPEAIARLKETVLSFEASGS